MFDIGMTELLVIAVVAIVVIGPKDLPGLLRTGAQYVRQIRSLARDFQDQISDAVREADLSEFKKLNPLSDAKESLDDYMSSARAFDEPDQDRSADSGSFADQRFETQNDVPENKNTASVGPKPSNNHEGKLSADGGVESGSASRGAKKTKQSNEALELISDMADAADDKSAVKNAS